MSKTSVKKVVVSSNVIEVYEYEKHCWYEFKGQGGRLPKGEGESERIEENRKLTTRRAREKIRRLALCNFDAETSRFLTLTFRDGSVDDVTNVEQCNKEFKKFIQRLKYNYGDFKYIAVIEFQDKNKRGAVHYHIMYDLPYIKRSKLIELWGNGSVDIRKMYHVDNLGAYLTSYMLKDIGDHRLRGKKCYLTSKNLDKPILLRGQEILDVERIYQLDKKEIVFTNSYESEHHGLITYKEYNIKRATNTLLDIDIV